MKEMYIALSKHGISIFYKCYNLVLRHGRKCPDKNTSKCFYCKYSKAQLSGSDATRLLESYINKQTNKG